MRLMKSGHAAAIVVAAAHSRVIRPGDVVDFDEAIHPNQGANYSLETALGHQASGFAATEEASVDVEPAALGVETAEARAIVEEASSDAEPAARPKRSPAGRK